MNIPPEDHANGVYYLVAVPNTEPNHQLRKNIKHAKLLLYAYDPTFDLEQFHQGLLKCVDDEAQGRIISFSAFEIVGDGDPNMCGPLRYCDTAISGAWIKAACMPDAWIILTGCNTGNFDGSVCISNLLRRDCNPDADDARMVFGTCGYIGPMDECFLVPGANLGCTQYPLDENGQQDLTGLSYALANTASGRVNSYRAADPTIGLSFYECPLREMELFDSFMPGMGSGCAQQATLHAIRKAQTDGSGTCMTLAPRVAPDLRARFIDEHGHEQKVEFYYKGRAFKDLLTGLSYRLPDIAEIVGFVAHATKPKVVRRCLAGSSVSDAHEISGLGTFA